MGTPMLLSVLLYMSATGRLISKNLMKLHTTVGSHDSRPWSSWGASFTPVSAGVTVQQGTSNQVIEEVSGEC